MTLHARIEATGEVSIRGSSRLTGQLPTSVLSEVIHCQGRIRTDDFGDVRCNKAVRREGPSLEAFLDLAPIARTLAATDEIELWLEHPRLGFETSSPPLNDEGGARRVVRTAPFTAGNAPTAIRIQFGYRRDQLATLYFPLAALVLVLVSIAVGLSRSGHPDLNRSLFLVGTIVWLGVATSLHAADPFRILLSGTPLANIVAALVENCPPLLCIAAGVALGSRNRKERTPGEMFAEVFWSYGIFLFPLMTALGAVPVMVESAWIDAAPWLVFAPLSIIVCRWRIRANAGSTVRQLNGGELMDRVSELAAKTGRHDVRVFVSSSTRSQVLNAFALLRNGIIMTAPLLQSLTRREVDAVVAHELSHFGHVRRNAWAALAFAAVLFHPPLTELFPEGIGWPSLAVLVPLIIFFSALHGARKREFAADAGSAALTGDPRSMISALAKITRRNGRPLDCHPVLEWFSTHPSTEKRIRALAAIARLDTAELAALRDSDELGAGYPLPAEEVGAVFTLAWQNANAARYTWTVLLGASGAGLLVAWLLDKFAGSGFTQLLGGILLGCAITKALAAMVMSVNYARLKWKLAAKLGVIGQLVGLAVDSEPRLYNGYRFSDAGFLSFEDGSLCYRSERTTIRLNTGDVLDVSMVAAAPSSWRRMQPMVRIRPGESGDANAFILHPVEWAATPRRLFRSIERWRAAGASAESTSISGLNAVAGKPFHVPSLTGTARGFRIPGTVTLVGATLAGWFFRTESWAAWYALLITAGAYTFLFLPALLYRPSALPPPLTPRIDTD